MLFTRDINFADYIECASNFSFRFILKIAKKKKKRLINENVSKYITKL